MYFSKTFISAALLGYAAATQHEVPVAAHTVSAIGNAAHTSTVTKVVAATAHTSVAAAAVHPSPAAPAAHASAVAQPQGHKVATEGTVVTHVVQVGGPNGTLRFYPDNVIAEIGELVQFQFLPKNHSVVQSTFDRPCTPIHDVMPNKTDAFFSGFMPTNRSITDLKNVLTYTIRVTSKAPMWYYCSQGQHCQAGMVGAINAPLSGERTVLTYAAGAKLATANLSPGQKAGAGAGSASPSGSLVPSAGVGGNGAGAPPTGAAGAPTGTSTSSPAQNSVNAAPGFADAARQSFMGLGMGGLVAFMLL